MFGRERRLEREIDDIKRNISCLSGCHLWHSTISTAGHYIECCHCHKHLAHDQYAKWAIEKQKT